MTDTTVEDFLADYEFRGDNGDYTPTDHDRALLADAIHGYLAAQPDTGDVAALREAVLRVLDGPFPDDIDNPIDHIQWQDAYLRNALHQYHTAALSKPNADDKTEASA